jgi:hypothetical protein
MSLKAFHVVLKVLSDERKVVKEREGWLESVNPHFIPVEAKVLTSGLSVLINLLSEGGKSPLSGSNRNRYSSLTDTVSEYKLMDLFGILSFAGVPGWRVGVME